MKMPAKYTAIARNEQSDICGGRGLISDFLCDASQFIFPDEKIAGESKSGYYPTFILVPEAIFLDYTALRVSNLLFRAASFLAKIGL